MNSNHDTLREALEPFAKLFHSLQADFDGPLPATFDATISTEDVRRAAYALSQPMPEAAAQGWKLVLLEKALVYVAHAGHATPLHTLPKGVTLYDGDGVKVKLDSGETVYAGRVARGESHLVFSASPAAPQADELMAQREELPPLPPAMHTYEAHGGERVPAFGTHQMRDYARAAIAKVRGGSAL